MTFLLYDRIELDERASKHLKIWKVWHLMLYICAAMFGIVNFVFLQNTMQLVDFHCVIFPRELAFRWVDLPIARDDNAHTNNMTDLAQLPVPESETNATTDAAKKVKRETNDDDDYKTNIKYDGNGTAITENTTHRLMLDTSRTLFEANSDCQFAEFMPILSTIFACVWITFFTMCPGGGRVRNGLQQPWRILPPALIFALVMVGLTGHSFTVTNKGLHAFCAAFGSITNSTTCSSVNPYIENSWNATWGLAERVASTRAASAGVLATWACAAALLLARCLAAPDFEVKRTGVYLTKDPHEKVLPHIKKSRSKLSQRSSNSSPTKRDTVSMRSEPTLTTELVSVSIEPGHDSAPSSLAATPVRRRNSQHYTSEDQPNF